ncbi:MAG: hypothetical protein HW421_1154 [Ignavibacteria bacterium]|nr:hypothetical protein [Ignavibacteria bacterium]
MYMMKIDPEQVTELYHRRESLKEEYGISKPITMQVREAIAEYITKNQNEKSPLIRTQKASKNSHF